MRIRSIKPEFWTSESIARLPLSSRLTFIALWSYVDDNGVGRDNERLVVADCFPLDDDPRDTLARVSRDLQTLAEAGRIVRYTAGGRRFLAVVNWAEHQKIDKPNRPRYASPEEADEPLTCENDPPDDPPDDPPESPRDTFATPSRHSREAPSTGAGEQGSRGAGEPPPTEVVDVHKPPRSKRGTTIPATFPTDADHAQRLREWARENAPLVDLGPETEHWRDWHLAKGDTAKDWTASWRTWMHRAQKDAAQRGHRPRLALASPRMSTTDQRVANTAAIVAQMREEGSA